MGVSDQQHSCFLSYIRQLDLAAAIARLLSVMICELAALSSSPMGHTSG
jgi:hypothetical protein